MGPSSFNTPPSNPSSECHWRKLDYDLANIHHSTFNEFKKHDSTTGIFCPNLQRAQYLSTQFLMSRPLSRTHPKYNRSWFINSIISNTHPYFIFRHQELPTAGNEDTSNTVNGTGSPVKGRIGQVAGPEGTHFHINSRALSFVQEFCQDRWRLPGVRESTMPLNGNVSASHWTLWV